ncbi:hypothetical protein F5X68DRAFT_238006 [Plectosphaerella plurivora]|uniref:Uncharacterized protein n=1 Tax=Plectosphaerella plurivora TaxID=936078 RepID=A0A9P8ZYL8_9PEZI|nr:hypothetical protein F5X68DRAFT_238006 [Plectosphaerella plurivora]
MAGNAAFSIVDIIDNPENAAMAVVGLLTAGRVRKPRDFVDLGSARRAQTKAGVAKMGDDFKKHDNSLQNVLGNCRQEGSKNDDDGPKQCNNKRDLDVGYHDDPLIFKRASDSFSGTTLTTPAKTCSAKWKQACYHYSSAMSVHAATPDMVRWTCWNRGAGSLWRQFCEKNDGYQVKANGVTKINEKFVKTTSAEVSKEIKTGTITYHTSVGVEIPNAVFEIKHWEQAPARDDGLWDNPCWASQLMPNDPGYALLINDPWYKKNPGATASTDLYSEPPLNPVTSGKTRSRMYAGNPRVAVRDNIWEDDGLVEDGGETTPFTSAVPAVPAVTGTFTQGDADAERRQFIDEDGTEFVEVVAEDVDCGELANALMASGEMPASTRPARRDAVASDVPGSEGEDLVHAAMPGSYVPDGRAKPT